MSDSSRHSLGYIAEVTYGTTPATPAFQYLRHTGASPALAKGVTISEEIRTDRNISDARHSTKQVGGDITGELSYATYDPLMEATLGGSWAAKAAPYAAGTISAASADNSINDSASGFPFLEPGDKITIAGFTGTPGNNQTGLVVVSRTTAKIVLSGGSALVTDPAGETVTITTLTNTLKVGTTRRSFSLLRNFADQTVVGDNPYHLFVGQEFNNMKIGITVDKLISIVFGIVGKSQSAPSDTAPADATFVAANTNRVFDSFTGSIYEGGVAVSTVTEFNITHENGITPRFVVGSDSTIQPSIGRGNVTGQVTAYAENATLLKKFLNGNESSLSVRVADASGNAYRINCPRILYTGGQMDTKGQGPITIPAPFQCLYDSTRGMAFSIDRIPA